MSLPTYHQILLTPATVDDLERFLAPGINLRTPQVFNLLALDPIQQRECIGLIENYFTAQELSFRFPYPVYLVTIHEASISRMPIVSGLSQLPRFFSQKEARMNVKEGHVAGKNRLLQQEIRNADTRASLSEHEQYAVLHRAIFRQEQERTYLRELLSRLVSGGIDG